MGASFKDRAAYFLFGRHLAPTASNSEVTEERPLQTEQLQDTREGIENTPPSGGRQTEETASGFLFGGDIKQELKPDFPVEWLKALYNLAAYNGDVSYAVENIVTLGNTKHTIDFGDEVPEELAAEMKMHLMRRSKHWYKGGMHSLINDLLAELAIAGCISAEQVVDETLTGIDYVVKVDPTTIRFMYDNEKGRYVPAQKVSGLAAASSADAIVGNKPLNENTYKYLALRRFKSSPYGVPPFLSAIESLVVQKDMYQSFKAIMSKMGMIGFLEVLVRAPQKLTGESPDVYSKRVHKYLQDEVAPMVNSQMSNGFAVGIKDTHEFKVNSVSQHAQGADIYYKMNETSVITGLKQDPAMLGRQFSTTETFGRVLLKKLTSQVLNYQILVSEFLSSLFRLELILSGYMVETVNVRFEKPMLGDVVAEQSAKTSLISNLMTLVEKGFISRAQAALEMGYDKPHLSDDELQQMFDEAEEKEMEKRRREKEIDNGFNADGNDTDPKKQQDSNKMVLALGDGAPYIIDTQLLKPYHKYELELTKAAPEFEYLYEWDEHEEVVEELNADQGFNDPELQQLLNTYNTQTRRQYKRAIKNSTTQIANELSKLPKNASLEQVVDRVLFVLFKNWGDNFSKKQKGIIETYVNRIYRKFRNDKSIFPGNEEDVKDAVFGKADTRTMEYFRRSDQLYLGRFITDADTKKKILAFIKDEYINNNTPIGNNKDAIAKFKAKFNTVLNAEDHKVRRVIDTTVNYMRNAASVNYMQQVGVEQFQIIEVNDQKTCDWCRNMNNRTFSVSKASKKLEEFANTAPEDVKSRSKFIVSAYSPDELADLDDTQLQSNGFSTPPYHPHCRGTVVAII